MFNWLSAQTFPYNIGSKRYSHSGTEGLRVTVRHKFPYSVQTEMFGATSNMHLNGRGSRTAKVSID